MVSLQRLRKFQEREVYTHFYVCCCQCSVILIPWVVAMVTNTVMMDKQPVSDTGTGLCPVLYPSSLWQFLIRICIVLGIPLLLVLMVFLTTLPTLSTCMGPVTWQTNHINHNIKQDLTILSVLFLAHILFQVPTKITECLIQYKHLRVDIFKLIVKISTDFPLLINPLGVLIIRGLGQKGKGKVERC
eukprot:TRINITY_DN20532_c0_g1_i1.p1 TRINITY_DN20532_c0_g1~~TRINITY_DN20532_c0_g1_i1.p1  ORF type:complete len:187 (+),score=28.09 TRINITY_DN20532_c0_g1_i1:411-971(+)